MNYIDDKNVFDNSNNNNIKTINEATYFFPCNVTTYLKFYKEEIVIILY